MVQTVSRVPVLLVLLVLIGAASISPAARAQSPAPTLVYHQITNLNEGSGYLGFPVLSADGARGVFSDAPGTGDPATPNRIYTIASDGSAMTEVDSYVPLCFCGAIVDISGDGQVVVSSDSVQIRIAGAGELVALTSNEITSVVITGDGETVFFLVRRDAATREDSVPVARGIWAINVDGSGLRQVVSADAVATATGVPVEQTGCCFHGDGHPLDVSDDGGKIVFGAFAGAGEHLFTVDGNGGSLQLLRQDLNWVVRVAISGDGSTVASDGIPLDSNLNVVEVVASDGGEPATMPGVPSGGFDEPLQLSQDGSRLLISPTGMLFDTGTGEVRLLGISILGAGGVHEAVITDGLARATMNAEGNQFLYAIRTVRCADCANLQEQLATLELDPAVLGEAPSIANPALDPAAIGLNGASSTTVEATIETEAEVLGVGFAALLDGLLDVNVGNGALLHDDGQQGDARAGDKTFTASNIVHSPLVVREDDSGPRQVRVAAEIEASDGMRHATAVDAGTLAVGDAPAGNAEATPAG